jgi:hypothetical protein
VDPDHPLTARINRPATTDDELDKNVAFFHALLEEIRTLPGVVSAGASSEVPSAPTRQRWRSTR